MITAYHVTHKLQFIFVFSSAYNEMTVTVIVIVTISTNNDDGKPRYSPYISIVCAFCRGKRARTLTRLFMYMLTLNTVTHPV